MKKALSLILFAAAVFSGCQKDLIEAQPEENNSEELTTIVAYLDVDTNSKLSLVDGVKLTWAVGDQIKVGNNKTFTVSTIDPDNPSKAYFTGTAPTAAEKYRAFYPTQSYSSSAGRFVLLDTQNYGVDNKVTYVNYMYAETTDYNEIHFHNVCGLLAIDLKGEGTVSNIQVSADQYMSGTLNGMAFSEGGALTYTGWYSSMSSKPATYVNLGCGKAATLSKDAARRFYIAVPEADYTNLKLTITTDKGTLSIPATKTASVKKNNIYHIPEITVDIKPLEFNATLTVDKCEATSLSEVDLVVSIVPEDKDVYYIPAVESASYVSSFEDALELAKEDIAYWKSRGKTTLNALISAGLAIKGDDLGDAQFYYCTPESDYVLYAYAVDEDLNVSAAIELPFTTPAYTLPPTSATYEDYLGTWTMGSTAITISQNVEGESYSITGIPGQADYDVPVVAEFDEGYFFLKEQQTSKMLYVDDTEYGYVYLSGIFMSTYPYYPWYGDSPQTILIGEYADGNIKVTPGSCEHAPFEGFALKLLSNADKLYSVGDIVSIDNLTPPAKLPEALFGQWTCASATDEISGVTYSNWVWTISEQASGVTIDNFDIAMPYVTGLNGTLVNSVAATYEGDDKAGTLTIKGGARTGLNDGTYYVSWYSDDYNSNWAIVFDVDLENGTISLHNGSFDCEASDVYTAYNAPLVFTKGAPVSAKANIASGSKIAGKSKVARHAGNNSKSITLILEDASKNHKAQKHSVKEIRF